MPKVINSPAQVSSIWAAASFFGSSFFRPAVLKSVFSVFKNFFFLQYKAVLLPGHCPVSQVDHPLDRKIPFKPEKVEIYLDFIHFFSRTIGFLFWNFKQSSREELRAAIESLGIIYEKAAGIYSKNLSTTKRPRYLARLKFLIIHIFDPHLMCIPSLHVMVVIQAYTVFRAILRKLGKEKTYSAQITDVRNRALAITEAVLYIKQHSINCISSSMYAMTCFDELFPPEEAEGFAKDLFKEADGISDKDAEAIRNHIIDLYRYFLKQKNQTWEKPLLDFLQSQPKN